MAAIPNSPCAIAEVSFYQLPFENEQIALVPSQHVSPLNRVQTVGLVSNAVLPNNSTMCLVDRPTTVPRARSSRNFIPPRFSLAKAAGASLLYPASPGIHLQETAKPYRNAVAKKQPYPDHQEEGQIPALSGCPWQIYAPMLTLHFSHSHSFNLLLYLALFSCHAR